MANYDTTKLHLWVQELLAHKDAKIARLIEQRDAARAIAAGERSVAFVNVVAENEDAAEEIALRHHYCLDWEEDDDPEIECVEEIECIREAEPTSWDIAEGEIDHDAAIELVDPEEDPDAPPPRCQHTLELFEEAVP